MVKPKKREALRKENKCFICKEEWHVAHDYPKKKRKEIRDEKMDRVDKGKKLGPSVGLVHDVIAGEKIRKKLLSL